ncbi:hypothetical protein WN48_07732 [Eufriesea mexicana]|uniref:Uncharacterized protein n=1 Tax=Eufriesea mexicana TaxID=516756 RepID=A0A310SRE8_9HYME|nr:hypothetical protein WN48_07732 [Eufriesea mexicana]
MISKKTDLLSNLFSGLGPAYPMDFKPFIPYTTSGSPSYNMPDAAQLLSKSIVNDGIAPYKRGIFGPFGSKPFDPLSPKFGPMSQFSSLNTLPNYSMKNKYSRKRRSIDEYSVAKLRSIMDNGEPEIKDLGPPPSYPTLAPISEEPEEDVNLQKRLGGMVTPKQYLPGLFGPFGPVMDPTMFIAKKSAFLDTLFKNIASTTPSPTSTEVPLMKSTIVAPDFWLPSSLIPSPMEYNKKVTQFLDKLFETLKLNKTMITTDNSVNVKNDLVRAIASDEDKVKIVRSVEDLSSINAAKDSIVTSILSELGDLKSNMVTTMNDLISYENSAASLSTKKPFKPFGPSAWSKSANGLLPFQQKIAILSQVFDMLTDLQKNITLAIENIMKAKMVSTGTSEETFNANYPMANGILPSVDGMFNNMSLLEAIKHKLDTLDYGMPLSYKTSFDKFGPVMTRTLSKSPASFWVSYPKDEQSIKREVDNDITSLMNEESNSNQKQQTRSVNMQMHQGYQSLPPGSIESIQAGGGSTLGHQGGGIKLFVSIYIEIKIAN